MSETPIGEVFGSMQTTFQQQPTGSAYSVEEHMFNQDEIQKRHPQPTDQQRSNYTSAEVTEILARASDDQINKLLHDIKHGPDDEACISVGGLAADMGQPLDGPASDQQRSEAVTEKKRCCCQCGKEMWCYISEEVQAAIAERDATIAELRAEVEQRQWEAAGCLTYAEGCQLGDKPANAATLAMRTVWQLRKDYQESREQIAALQARVATLEEVLQNIERFESGPMSTMESVKTHLRNMARAALQSTPTTEK